MKNTFYDPPSEIKKLTAVPFIAPMCSQPFPRHVHDVVEIVCVLAGQVTVTVAEETLRLAPGDVAVIFPSLPHSYDFVSEDADGIALVFSPNTFSELSSVFRTRLPVSPLMRAHQLPPELKLLLDKIRLLVASNAIYPLRYGYLHLFLTYLLTVLPLHPVKRSLNSSVACQVLTYISEHFTEPLSLEGTAHALGISRIHLSHVFSQQLHINFRQYINILRIDHACMLLRDPTLSISEIALQCGFGNSRTFHRAFMAQCRMTPGDYRADLNHTVRPDKSDHS